MKQTVLTIEQMKRLQELGLDTSNASCCHYKASYHRDFGYGVREIQEILATDFLDEFERPSNFEEIPENNVTNGFSLKEVIPAFILQDILELLPKKIEYNGVKCELTMYSSDGVWLFKCENRVFVIEVSSSENILESAYNALVWCLENGYEHLIIK